MHKCDAMPYIHVYCFYLSISEQVESSTIDIFHYQHKQIKLWYDQWYAGEHHKTTPTSQIIIMPMRCPCMMITVITDCYP